MAAFDAAVSGLDTAPDLRLAAHQYEQLLHLLASADARRVPPAAAARRVHRGRDEAFGLVSTMRQKYGLAPRLRSYSPVLAMFRRAGEAGKAYAVEAHMAASAVSPEEPEFAALHEVSATVWDADKVYEYMHKLQRAVGCVIEETTEVLEGRFRCEKAATAGKAEWDVCQVRTPLRRTTVGAINWGGFGPDHGWCSEPGDKPHHSNRLSASRRDEGLVGTPMAPLRSYLPLPRIGSRWVEELGAHDLHNGSIDALHCLLAGAGLRLPPHPDAVEFAARSNGKQQQRWQVEAVGSSSRGQKRQAETEGCCRVVIWMENWRPCPPTQSMECPTRILLACYKKEGFSVGFSVRLPPWTIIFIKSRRKCHETSNVAAEFAGGRSAEFAGGTKSSV
uniref:PROP1-like PPR domain-containing protein n=1 Tax=Triticum aestivum TaxID=4565 RepID=A0A077RX01_WHEAT|nr:unnamed protein product [Triticum aestivum]